MSSPPQAETPRQLEWHETFSDICDRHRGRLIRWVTAIFGPRDAEDIAQETLARLYCRPDLLDGDADAWPWLAVVSRNLGRDLARHNAFSTTVDSIALAHVPADVVVPDEVVARDEGERLARALRSLTPRERSVIRLRDFEGASVADIAELLGLTENAVRQQLFRARRRLAAAYVQLGGDSRVGALVAACGLRLRELARRYSPFANDLAPPSAAAMSAALPAIAAVLGGLAGLLPGVGGDASGSAAPDATAAHAALGAPWDARDGEVRHGTGGRTTLAAPPAPPPPRPGEPIRVAEEVPGLGGVDATAADYFSTEGERTNHHYIYVDVPVVNERLWVEGWEDRRPGGGLICQSGVVRCGP